MEVHNTQQASMSLIIPIMSTECKSSSKTSDKVKYD